jgi:hypothetical protein
MLPVLRVLAVVTTIGLALPACTGGEDADEASTWWEDILSYMPADATRGDLFLSDHAEARRRFDVAADQTGTCDEIYDSISEEEQERFLEATTAVGIGGDAFFNRFPLDQKEIIGFDLCEIGRHASAGVPPDTITAYDVIVSTAAIPGLLEGNGFSQREYGGESFFSRGEDHEIIDADTISYLNRVYIDGAIVLRTSADGPLEAALDARSGEGRDDEAASIARALGDFQAAYFPPQDFDFWDFERLILGAGGGFVPREQVEAKRREIAEQHADWGRLPRAARIAGAYARVDDANIMKVALLYEDGDEAGEAADELALRLPQAISELTKQPICVADTAATDVVNRDGAHVVVASCHTESPGRWLQTIFVRDTLFLVEELPQP